MSLDSGLAASIPVAHRDESDLIHAREAEAIERIELPFPLGPARGILNAVLVGTAAWSVILAGAALIRAILFG